MSALLALVLIGPYVTMNNDTGQGNLLRQIGYLAVAALGIFAVRPLAHPQRLIVVPWALVLALAWCWLSMTWAIDPAIGSRRLVLTTIVIVSVFILAPQLGHDRLLLLVRIALGVALAGNFATVLLYPEIGIHGVAEGLKGDWRGFMAHKNAAGLASALTIVFFAFDRGRMPHAVQAAVIALSAVFLFQSDSRTSMGVCLAAVIFGAGWFFALPWLQRGADGAARHPRVAWTMFGGVVAVLALVFYSYYDALAAVLADPKAFTGRTLIWQPLLRSFLDRPVLGVGYGSFWDLGPNGPLYRYASGQWQWVGDVSEAHNGYLDLLVQIGVPGLLLVLFATVVWPFRRLLRDRDIDRAGSTLVAAVIFFCVGHNFTESSLFDRDSIGQVFLMLAIALLQTLRRAAPLRSGVQLRGRSALRPRS